jgi:hypothetical protein
MRDRRVLGDAAVHQLALSPRDGRQDPGDGGACHDGVDDGAAREEGLVPGDDVNSNDVQQNRELLEASSLEVLGHELSQPGARTR